MNSQPMSWDVQAEDRQTDGQTTCSLHRACCYRVRGVNGSCVTAFHCRILHGHYLPTVILIHHPLTLSSQAYNLPFLQILLTAAFLFLLQDSLHGFNKLKTFLFCESFPLQPFFFFFSTDYMDSPDFYCYFSAYSVLYFFSFSVLHFLVVVSVR